MEYFVKYVSYNIRIFLLERKGTTCIAKFCFSFVLVLCFSCLIVFSFSYKQRRSINEQNDDSSTNELYQYKMFSWNDRLNKSYSGIVTYPTFLRDEEYYTFTSEDNSVLSLISNFRTNEYFCTGSCYCEHDITEKEYGGRRITTSTVIRKGIYTLVASVTSLMAYNQAKDFFETECSTEENEFWSTVSSSECTSSIRSEVNECVDVKSSATYDNSEITTEKVHPKVNKEHKEEEKDGMITKRYFCSGNCIPQKFKLKTAKRISEQFKCNELKREGNVTILVKKNSQDSNSLARSDFQKLYLTQFCKKVSRYTVDYDHYNKKDGKIHHYLKEISLCIATSAGMNPSVKCVQTCPEKKPPGSIFFRKKKKY